MRDVGARRGRRWIGLGDAGTVVAIVGGVVIGAVLATLVVGGPPSEPSADRSREATITRALPPSAATPPATPARLGPEATVRRFYRRLGERRFDALYALVGEDFRARATLAEYAARRRGGAARRRAQRAACSVWRMIAPGPTSTSSSSSRAARERCTGRLALTRPRGRWRIDPGTVTCR